MIISFIVGMVELIIGGILDLIADDLHVSLGKAGLLITIFSLILAVAGPILLVLTAKAERKRLTIFFLIFFFIGNVITVFSPNYAILFMGRIVSALSASLLIILCLVMAPTIVDPKYRGRAIGIVSMGVSASLVLGVPLGLMLGNAFGWRAPFVLISILALLSIIGVVLFMDKVEPRPSIPLSQQLASLKNKKIFFAQSTTLLFMAGHTTLYAYLTPFLKTTMGMQGNWVSIAYLIFGIAAVTGGGFGGTLADLIGTKRTILSVIILFAIAIFAIPYSTFALALFIVLLVVWGMMSWAMSPAMQSYLIEASPETSDIQQSLNNSALHFGIAIGSLVGGIVIGRLSVAHNAAVGGILILMALGTALISMNEKSTVSKRM